MSGITLLPFEIPDDQLRRALMKVIAEDLAAADKKVRKAIADFYSWGLHGQTTADVLASDFETRIADLRAAYAEFRASYDRLVEIHQHVAAQGGAA